MEGCNQTTCHGPMPRTEVLIVACKDKKGGISPLPTLQGWQTPVCSVTSTSPEFRVVECGHRPTQETQVLQGEAHGVFDKCDWTCLCKGAQPPCC